MNPWPKRVVWIALIVGILVTFFWALPSPEPATAESTEAFAIQNVRVFDGEEVLENATVPTGTISDFETGELDTAFGFGWIVSLDDRMGGSSTAELNVLQENGDYFLQIDGEILPGAPYPWAGAMYFPADEPMSPVDASAASGIAFRARGDGSPGRIIVFASRLSQMPAIVTFETTAGWQEYEYPFSAFSGIDGSDLTGIVFSGPMFAGPFRLEIDDLELR